MTTITYKVLDSIFESKLEIKVTGHSGYAENGSDIVCASISTAMLLTHSICSEISCGVVHYTADENKPSMKLTIRYFSNEDKKIFNCLLNFFNDLQEQYPKYVKVEEIK